MANLPGVPTGMVGGMGFHGYRQLEADEDSSDERKLYGYAPNMANLPGVPTGMGAAMPNMANLPGVPTGMVGGMGFHGYRQLKADEESSDERKLYGYAPNMANLP